jgi:hypothetical protein
LATQPFVEAGAVTSVALALLSVTVKANPSTSVPAMPSALIVYVVAVGAGLQLYAKYLLFVVEQGMPR